MSEKSNASLRRKALATGKYLQRNGIVLQLNHLGQRGGSVPVFDDGQIAKTNIVRADFQDVADDSQDVGVMRKLVKHSEEKSLTARHQLKQDKTLSTKATSHDEYLMGLPCARQWVVGQVSWLRSLVSEHLVIQ